MANRTRAERLLRFMDEAPEGKYEVVKPTDAQLAEFLPYIVDKIIKWARAEGHCGVVNDGIAHLVSDRRDDPVYYAADGLDCAGRDREGRDADGFDRNGYNAEGRDRRGFDRNGYNADGYSRYGYDKDGFDRNGRDERGHTRQEKVTKLVGGWSREYATAVAAKLAEREAAKAAEAEAAPVPTEELAATAA